MKVQVQANYWHKIIDHYNNVLNERFLGQVYTATVQYYMRHAFEAAIRQAKSRETHPAWHIPLQLRFEPLQNRFFVEAADPSQLELL